MTHSRRKSGRPRLTHGFNAAFYKQFYIDAATRVTSRTEIRTRAALVAALVKQLDISVRRILDVGCGLGWYERPLRRVFGAATYTGMEVSKYLCDRKGWVRGSIAALKLKGQFDLVICADVLQYLSDRDAVRALANLGTCCRGALYFHVPTRRDWLCNIDQSETDGDIRLRSGAWYRKRLRRHFVHVGCGVHLKNDVPFAQWELEGPWR